MNHNRELTFAQRYGDDYFEMFTISYDGLYDNQVPPRVAHTTRQEHRINGKRVSRAKWIALKEAAVVLP